MRWKLVCLTVIIYFAGCSAPLIGEEQAYPTQVVLSNEANSTLSFTVWVVDSDAEFRTTLNDSRQSNITFDAQSSSFSAGDYYWTSVEMPDSAQLRGKYTVKSGDIVRTNISNLPHDAGIIVIPYKDDETAWIGGGQCSGSAINGIEVRTRPHEYTDGSIGVGCGI